MQQSFVEDVFSFDNDYESSVSVSRSRSPQSRRVHYSVAPVPIRVHREASPAPVGSGSPTPLPLDERDAQTRRWIHTQFRPSQPLYDEYEDSFNTPTKSVFDSDTEDEVDEDELLSEDDEDDYSSTSSSSSSSSDESDSEAIYMQPSNRTSFTSLFPQPPTTIPVVVPIRRPSPVRSFASSSQSRLRACASGGLRPLTPASAAPALLCQSRAAGSLVDTSSLSPAVATPTFDTDEDLPALAHSESTSSSSSSSAASSDDEERSVPIPIYISCPTSRGRRVKPGYDAYEDIHSPPHAARKERQMFRSNSWMHDWAMRPESYATRR